MAGWLQGAAGPGAGAGRRALRVSGVFGLSRAFRRHPDLVLGGGIVLVALALRLAFFFRTPPLLVLRDSASYALPALDLVQGLGFDPELKRPPLYPLLLAGGFWFFGEDLRGPLLLQHLLGALGAGLTYLLGRKLWGRAAGVAAGLLTALNGDLLVVEHSILSEGLFAVLLVGAVLAGVGAGGARPVRWALAAGGLLGLAALTRPSALALAPLLAVGLAWSSAGPSRRRIMAGGAVLLGCAAVVGPWTVRNGVVHGSFAIAGGSGEALISRTRHHDRAFGADVYVARGAEARIESADRFASARRWVYRQLARTDQADEISLGLRRELGLSQRDADQVLREIAIHGIQQDPGRYLRATARMSLELLLGWDKELSKAWETAGKPKLRDDWGERGAHLLGPPTPSQNRELTTARALVEIHDHVRVGGLLAVLFLTGLVTAAVVPRFRSAVPAALAVVVLLGLSAALAGPLVRYRAGVDPLLAVVAAGGLVGLWEAGRSLARQVRVVSRGVLASGRESPPAAWS